MPIFHRAGVSVSSEGKHNSDYIALRPYCAIPTPTLLPQKQRDAFLAKMGTLTTIVSTPKGILSSSHRSRILYGALAVLLVMAAILGLLWRLQLL
jgi:hypothetical protein